MKKETTTIIIHSEKQTGSEGITIEILGAELSQFAKQGVIEKMLEGETIAYLRLK